ncbi:hypothetical protein YA0089_27200 [Pseudomonas viridiflava]|uniref:hypothetical protein n=1 Tax=Pseudomonas viridiflava TaxID=33069 RepID=UPI0018E6370F|nr:hypothetical protein [Pseudomonas viridiflava]MBI6727306.1 hypothetical protein [Pseudomonas viridiflava]
MTRQIIVKLSSEQESVVGKVLYDIYYRSSRAYVEMAPGKSGYPHNGGEHSLTIKGSADDCIAYVEILAEKFPQALAEFTYVLDQIKSGQGVVDVRKFIPSEQAA